MKIKLKPSVEIIRKNRIEKNIEASIIKGDDKLDVLKSMEDEFSMKEMVNACTNIKGGRRTIERFIKKLVDTGELEKIDRGQYKKL